MFVMRLDVPDGTRLSFQTHGGPLTHQEAFHDLGLVVLAEQHSDSMEESPDEIRDNRMVLECEGVEVSVLSQNMNWPRGETVLPGIVRFGELTYPAELQIRARPNGLRATLRSLE